MEQGGLGVVAGAETGFLIASDPDTVRAPDVAFIRAERVPSAPVPGFFQGAPDLAVWSVSDELTGDDIVPNFTLPVAEIFAR